MMQELLNMFRLTSLKLMLLIWWTWRKWLSATMRRKRDWAGCCAMSTFVLLMVRVIQQAASGCFPVTGIHLPVLGYTLTAVFFFIGSFLFSFRFVLNDIEWYYGVVFQWVSTNWCYMITLVISAVLWLSSLLIVQILHGVVFRWFDSGRDDGLIERELNVVHYVQSPPPQEETEEDERGNFSLPVPPIETMR